MVDRIAEEKKKRYDELKALMADPKVIANSAQYQACAKEFALLGPIARECERYIKTRLDLEELVKVLKEMGHEADFLVLA